MIPISMALGLLTDEAYSLEDACRYWQPAQYIYVIIHHRLGCNIVDIANQLLFAYKGLAPELRVFITLLTDTTKATDFIEALEEKLEV